MIADRITGGPTTDDGFLGFRKTGNLIPKSATKGDRAAGLTNSTKGSPSFRIHPCAANPVSGSSHFSLFSSVSLASSLSLFASLRRRSQSPDGRHDLSIPGKYEKTTRVDVADFGYLTQLIMG